MKKLFRTSLFLFLFFSNLGICFSQNDNLQGLDLIKVLINNGEIEKADTELSNQIEYFKSENNYDTLIYYVYHIGKIEILKEEVEDYASKSLQLAEEIERETNNEKSLSEMNIILANLFFELGEVQIAHEYSGKAKQLAIHIDDAEYLLNAEYYLGEYSMKMGDIVNFEHHIRASEQIVQRHPNDDFAITARVYNLMGGVMYYSSMPDSAIYYFEKALGKIDNMNEDTESRLYLSAMLHGNMSTMNLNLGLYSEAMDLIKESVRLNYQFLELSDTHELTPRVQKNIIFGYRTIASLYKDIGDYQSGLQMTKLSYDFAKSHLLTNTMEYFSAVLNLAEFNSSAMEFQTALLYLDEARESLMKIDGENTEWEAQLNYVTGQVFYGMGEQVQAKASLEKADSCYSQAHDGGFSRDRMFCALELAVVYSELKQSDKAIALIKQAYNACLANEYEFGFMSTSFLVSLAQVSLDAGAYENSLTWSQRCLDIYEKNRVIEYDEYNLLLFEENKARVILYQVQANYYLTEERSIPFLESLLSDLDKAIVLLEDKKAILSSLESINLLIEENNEIIDFAKLINLELYNKTERDLFMHNAISLHESALYSRIRARMNINNSISFSGIPEDVKLRENALRFELSDLLIYGENEDAPAFIDLNKEWHQFLDSLQTNYSEYHTMRYAPVEKSLGEMREQIPSNCTVLRYFFVDDNLYAYILNEDSESLVYLEYDKSLALISNLENNKFDVEQTGKILYQLYGQLWAPLANLIKHENIIIIPDEELFNLSFESLTASLPKTYSEMVDGCLLNKYAISYNFSLHLMEEKGSAATYENNYISFAPEFNDAMKDDYLAELEFSGDVDDVYMNLLPQPFVKAFAEQTANMFDGECFLNSNSTESIFKAEARNHKVIYIGTHAECNNLSPELSRLIFAKTKGVEEDDNSLYNYEIYDCDLSCDLAILTACETGKPSYQSGEGMISLAHAFNYAGSQSILTSLWKIDEKSSVEIIALFNNNIADGLSKSKALQQAKLDYLKSAEGRTLSPQYWAGLVLIGNTSAIELNKTSEFPWAIFVVLFVVIIITARRRMRRKEETKEPEN